MNSRSQFGYVGRKLVKSFEKSEELKSTDKDNNLHSNVYYSFLVQNDGLLTANTQSKVTSATTTSKFIVQDRDELQPDFTSRTLSSLAHRVQRYILYSFFTPDAPATNSVSDEYRAHFQGLFSTLFWNKGPKVKRGSFGRQRDFTSASCNIANN